MPKHSLYTWDMVEQIIQQPHILGHLCGYTDLLPIHSDWIHYIHNGVAGADRGLLASRSSYKSTALVIVGTIYRLMRNPNETIAICRKSYGAAADVVRTIANLMETPHIYELLRFVWFADRDRNLSNKAQWKFNIRKEGALNLSVRKTQSPEPNVLAVGVDSRLVGKHVDFAILDDMVDIKDRLYQSEREYTKVVVSEIRANIVKKTGYSGIINTPYHADDCIATLEAEGVPFQKFPYQMLPFIAPEEIEKARRALTDALFKINYELDYTNTLDMLFADPFMDKWEFVRNKEVKAHIDAGYAGEDKCALTITAKMMDGRINVVGFTTDKHIKDWIPFVYQKLQLYKCNHLYMETNADQGLMLEKIVQHPLSKTHQIIPHSYRETQNKTVKIATYVKEAWLKLVFAHETDVEYMARIVDWNENTKSQDDPPDSLASILREGHYITGGDAMSIYRAYA